jgi:hypothetical protein
MIFRRSPMRVQPVLGRQSDRQGGDVDGLGTDHSPSSPLGQKQRRNLSSGKI